MRLRPFIAGVLFSVAVASPLSGGTKTAKQVHLPVSFEANQGQTDSQVKFLARGPAYTLFLTPTGSVLKTGRRSVQLKLAGANPTSQLTGRDELPGQSNYLIGNDPAAWRSGVKRYSKVRCTDVYPGIDLVYYGNPQDRRAPTDLEYDFVVAPGADPSAIAFDVRGGKVRVDAAGDLVIGTDGSEIRMHRPAIYQDRDGQRRSVAGGYVLKTRTQVRFRVGEYDPKVPLVIDPTFVVARYLGGSGTDFINGIATDAAGNVYVAGQTDSPNFPTTTGTLRTSPPVIGKSVAFVTKLDPSGSIIYSTFIGGSGGDAAFSMALGPDGSVYISGSTASTDFPTVVPYQSSNKGGQDGFVARLNPGGTALLYSTYFGGGGFDFASALALGADGSVYISGFTTSTNLPTLGAFQSAFKGSSDAYVAKFNPSGTLAYSSYLGGAQSDSADAIVVDAQGNAYIAGNTSSTDFPITSGAVQKSYGGNGDGFVAKVNPSGNALVYCTFLGGNGSDNVNDLAVDPQGNVWLAGATSSTNFPTVNPTQAKNGGGTDMFLSGLDPTGTKLFFSTYYGGNSDDIALKIVLLSSPQSNWVRVALAGTTASSNLSPAPAAVRPKSPTYTPDCPDDIFAFFDFLAVVASFPQFVAEIIVEEYLEACVISPDPFAFGFPFPFSALPVDELSSGAAAAPVGLVWQAGNIKGSSKFVSGTAPGGPFDGFLLAFTVPVVPSGGVVNASFGAGTGLAAGGIASIFGSNLASSTTVGTALPLASTLAGTSVQMWAPLVNPTIKVNAPLYFSAAGQINFQIPWEFANQPQAGISVSFGGFTSVPLTLNLSSAGPGIFTTNSQGTGQGAIQIANTAIFAAPLNSIAGVQTRPAAKGDFLTIYCTGLGAVANTPASGAPAPGATSTTLVTPTVSIGGVATPAVFSGLSPGFVGLYQVNVQVPATAPSGDAVPLILSVGTAKSNTVTIAVAP